MSLGYVRSGMARSNRPASRGAGSTLPSLIGFSLFALLTTSFALILSRSEPAGTRIHLALCDMPTNGTELALPFPWWPIATTMTSCGVFGNSLIVAATLVERHIKGASSTLIGILALADLSSCLGMYLVRLTFSSSKTGRPRCGETNALPTRLRRSQSVRVRQTLHESDFRSAQWSCPATFTWCNRTASGSFFG